MKRNGLYFGIILVSLLALVFLTLTACGTKESQSAKTAEKFPTKQIRMIDNSDVGGSSDVLARGIAPYLEKYLGVPVVVENMPGAGGRRNMEFVYAAEPDGYVLAVSGHPSRLIGELLEPDRKYVMKNFASVGAWCTGDSPVINVDPKKFDSFEALLEESKKRPLKAAGGGGIGSSSHLQYAYFKEIVKMNVVFMPCESGAEAATMVLGGFADFSLHPLSSALPRTADGKMKILVSFNNERRPEIPDVPTLEELGYKGTYIPYVTGLWAPPGTPADRVKILEEALKKATSDPDYIAWTQKAKVNQGFMTGAELEQLTLSQYDSIGKVLPIMQEDKKK